MQKCVFCVYDLFVFVFVYVQLLAYAESEAAHSVSLTPK